MSSRRHKLAQANGATVLADVRHRYTFGAGQAFALVGDRIQFAHGDQFEHTVIYPADGIETVKVKLYGDYQAGSLIVYCDEEDHAVKLLDIYRGQYPEIPVEFPPGSVKVYVSSAPGTARIYKHLLKFGKR